jgi:predicted ester cyclase
MRDILDPAIDFRGSIGLQVNDQEGFAGYMQTIRDAFSGFHNRIDDIVATDDRAVARLTYTGTHDGPLFDHAATGTRIEYAGVAMFTMAGGKITKVWVLGDRLVLLQQIGVLPAN